MKDRIFTNGTEYTLVGDYYIPNIALPEENRPIGRWGRMHRDYLEQHHPIRFNDLVLSGQLWTYLADLNEQAQNRLELIIKQMKAAEGVTERMKQHDQMAWVGAMNSIRNRAEEIILREMIYGEDVA
ncbi:MAG: TnpV protein [Clostridiales bacterium]|nr:TnpV protein [Clostridiales bacterium]